VSAPKSGASEQAQPRPISPAALGVCGVLLAVGAVAFLAGIAADPATAWRAFHVNYLYFAGVGQAGIVLACSFVIIGARWPGPVQRIAEGLGAWVPFTLVLFVVDYLGGRSYVYEWIAHPLPAKTPYLNQGRLFLMDFGILLVLAILTFSFLRASVRPALHGAAEGADGLARTLFERWTVNWRGEAAEREESNRRLRRLAPVICLLYAFGYSFIGIDQVMSLSPTWYSNLFGAFFAWGGFLSGISVTALLTVLHRSHPGLEGEITKGRLHDLGKMIFAFSIFWMYLFFSQYLVIWYGNLPEETSFIRDRLGSQFLQSTWYFSGFWGRIWGEPWVPVTLFAWLCVWVIPFWCLLGQKPKRTAWFLGGIAAISAFGFWLERNVLVWPSLAPQDTWAWLGWIQVGIALGFLGGFALVYLTFTRVFPTLAVPRRA
jgi:hypothetical protein